MKPTVINIAEAIIEPFWDPAFDRIKSWVLEDGTDHGLRIKQQFCFVEFEWSRKPVKGPVLSMSKKMKVDCSGYDTLAISISGPESASFTLQVHTEKGNMAFESKFLPFPVKEYFFNLSGANTIEEIQLNINSEKDSIESGWINWIGLQDTALMERYIKQWESIDEKWEDYLKPDGYEPSFIPYYGIIINQAELEIIRIRHEGQDEEEMASIVKKMAEMAESFIPENLIRDFVNLWEDTRFCRDRDIGRFLLNNGINAATAGVVLKDARLLRLAARYAMSIALCGHWDDGMICAYPGGVMEHRCYTRSSCINEIGQIMDLAGEMFTETGREFLLRRIAQEGLGGVNFIAWKHEYCFHNNQMSIYSLGRMVGYAILSKHQPRVVPYMELAYRDIVENIENTVLPDGGSVEGPSYQGCISEYACQALYYYARAKGLSFKEVIPDVVYKTVNFVEALMSTDEKTDFIPVCNSGENGNIIALSILAAIMPESHWTTLYRKCVARISASGCSESPLHLLVYKFDTEIPESFSKRRSLVEMPDTAITTSFRMYNDSPVKLLIMGNKPGATHNHEDKGSFVLVFAGETFAMDPGVCDYSTPMHNLYGNCERHNMLVPFGTIERPHPQNPIMTRIQASATGDEVGFSARIDAATGWKEYYSKWVRTWSSPTPEYLEIVDDYSLKQGQGVEFYWNTMLDCEIKGNEISVNGEKGAVKIWIPEDCTARIDTFALFGGKIQKRIAISKNACSGKLRIKVWLQKRESQTLTP